MLRRFGWLTLVLFAWLPSLAEACSTPVFRYALENWPSGRFAVLVFHRGPLTADQSELVKRFTTDEVPANAITRLHDLSKEIPAAARNIWEKYGKGQSTPCLMVRYPEDARPAPIVVAPLTEDNVERILTSPARRELTQRLGQGDSAVWVVLGQGDSLAAKTAMLEAELARLHKEIALPPPDPDFPLRAKMPLELRFTVLIVDRTDPREAFFVQSLLGSEDGLAEVKGPIVFPIFGRGRVLIGLHGKQWTAANIDRWASFLCGPCSCRVKELNPGVDLLLRADWEEILDLADAPAKDEKPTPAVAIPPGGGDDAPAKTQAVEPESRGSLGWLWLVLGAGGLLGAGAGLRLMLQRAPPILPHGDQVNPSTSSTTQQPR